ncbi:MAG: 50S ribosomal protein L10 [Candidatus Diapherotrites archaeon]|nr:50S ribosomal protein L10 [Candidatus Diapherotrites archaeon]
MSAGKLKTKSFQNSTPGVEEFRKGAEKPAAWKAEAVSELANLLGSYNTVALANISGLPAAQLQTIRKGLHKDVKIIMTRRSLLKRSLEIVKKKNLEKLSDNINGPFVLLLSNNNPFELYNTVNKKKSKAPAKAGMIAPNDIVVKEMDTGIPPGPALTDLKVAGLDVAPIGGTIKVKKDCTLTKAGEEINSAVANALGKLGLKPMEIGINIAAIWEKEMVYSADVLRIDEDEVRAKYSTAAMNAFNLAFSIGYFTTDNIKLFIQKAAREAKSLAREANILTSETVGEVLAKADMQAKAISAKLGDYASKAVEESSEQSTEEKQPEVVEKKPEETPAEPSAEEPKEEAPEGEKTE